VVAFEQRPPLAGGPRRRRAGPCQGKIQTILLAGGTGVKKYTVT
jgi:hypothetical protein